MASGLAGLCHGIAKNVAFIVFETTVDFSGVVGLLWLMFGTKNQVTHEKARPKKRAILVWRYVVDRWDQNQLKQMRQILHCFPQRSQQADHQVAAAIIGYKVHSAAQAQQASIGGEFIGPIHSTGALVVKT